MNDIYAEKYEPQPSNIKKEQNSQNFNIYENITNTKRLVNTLENPRYSEVEQIQNQDIKKTPERQKYSPDQSKYQQSNEIQYQELSNNKINLNIPSQSNSIKKNITNYDNNYNRLSPRTIYENELLKHNYPNMRSENNQNLEIINEEDLEKNEYISAIITKIAKKNYLCQNPYTNKKEDLGPSMLQINPILYPIDSYKFDFDRYKKKDYVKKKIDF